MKWSTICGMIVVIILALIALGLYIEEREERFQYRINTAQKTLEEQCKGLYPSHLQGMPEEEIKLHPDFLQYQRCLAQVSKTIDV